MSPEARVLLHLTPNKNQCWIFKGAMNRGYGVVWSNGGNSFAHRILKSFEVGYDIPSSLVVHHKCRVTACCNPSHLSIITLKENTLENNSRAITAINLRKNVCIRGHNSWRKVKRGRVCSICQRQSVLKWRLQNREHYLEQRRINRIKAKSMREKRVHVRKS